MSSVGQYEMVSRNLVVNHGDRKFRVLVYGAYNAGGLIGPENNGIAVLDEDRRQVVLDGHFIQETGYFGPSADQVMEWRRICCMDAGEFVDFCNSHRMLREPVDLSSKCRKSPKFDVRKFVTVAMNPVAYDHQAKEDFLRMGRQMALRLASALGLNEDGYDVRVNKGGIAVSGEVTLHTDTHYVQFCQFPGADGFLVRTCKGRKDYTGGRNHWVQWGDLRDLKRVAEFILSLP